MMIHNILSHKKFLTGISLATVKNKGNSIFQNNWGFYSEAKISMQRNVISSYLRTKNSRMCTGKTDVTVTIISIDKYLKM